MLQLPPIGNEYLFEEFVCDLFNFIYDTTSFQAIGSRGQKQDGIDIFSFEKKTAIQCKKKDIRRNNNVIRSELKKEMMANLQLVNLSSRLPFYNLFFVSTYKDDVELTVHSANLSNDSNIVILYYGWDTLSRYALRCPNILKKYYSQFCLQSKRLRYINAVPNYDITNFIGRDLLLQSIHSKLEEAQSSVLVNGIGGIGKTTAALAYVNTIKYIAEYNHIAWVVKTDRLKDDIINQLSGINIGFKYDHNNSTEINYRNLLDLLRQIEGNNLIVIDNANDPSEIDNIKPDLEALRWKVLFTSRSIPNLYNIIHVNELPFDDAMRLFYKFYNRDRDDKTLQLLLKHINYHTLLIELLAKASTANKRLSISKLYELIMNEDIKANCLQVDIQINNCNHAKHAYDKNRLYNYIMAIFDIDSLNDIEKYILLNMSVLPSIEIKAVDLFDYIWLLKNTETFFFDALNHLTTKGWLQEHDDAYRMHQLIQLVVREKLKPDVKNCLSLIRILGNKAYDFAKVNPIGADKYLPFLESIFKQIPKENDEYIRIVTIISSIYRYMGNYKKALEHELVALDVAEKKLSQQDHYFGCIYNNIAMSYEYLSDLENSLKYGLKAINILEHDETDLKALARAYVNLGITYSKLNNYMKEQEYCTKAIEIYDNLDDCDLLDSINLHHNLAISYFNQNKYEIALKHELIALDMADKPEFQKHPFLSMIFKNLAKMYEKLGEKDKVLPNALKATTLREATLPKNHPDLARSYKQLATIYCFVHDNKLIAKKYIDKAIKILREYLPEGDDEYKDTWQIQQMILYHRKNTYDNTTIYDVDSMTKFNNKVGRNDKCPCGSGLKYKRCCGK